MTRYPQKPDNGNVNVNSFLGRAAGPGRRRARAAAPFKRRLLVETIEQRVLMDADPLSVATVAGSIDSAGEVDRYTFHLESNTRLAFDSLTNNSSLNWQLSGPSGPVIDQAYFRSLSSTDSDYAPLNLSAGDYRLDVYGSGDTTGAYAMRLLDLARASAVNLDAPITGSFEAGAQVQAFAFDAQAGDQLFLTWQQRPDVYLRIYDPFGQQVNSGYGAGQYYDSAVPALPYTGRYTMLLDASGNVAAGAQFGFTLHRTVAPVQDLGAWSSPALAIDALLAEAGDRAVYTFTLDAARSVILDSLTYNDSMRVSLTGPSGTVVDSSGQAVTDRGLAHYVDHAYYGTDRLDLRPGRYTLVLSGIGNASGAAGLRLLDLENGTIIAKGNVVSAELPQGNAVQLFRFDAAAGDAIDIDMVSASGGSPSYKLLDPYGRKVTYAWSLQDLNGIRLDIAGRYTLVVSGENARTAPTSYSFQLVGRGNTPPEPLPAGTPFALGDTAEGSIAAGESQVWNFSLDAPTTVYFDPLNQNPGYWSATWSLQGPRGTEVGGATYGGYQWYPWDDGGHLLTLPAGDYALNVRSTNAMPSVKFRLIDVEAVAAPAAPNTEISGRLDPGSGAAAYRFEAAAGQRLFVKALPHADSGWLRYRLLDADGREVGNPSNWSDWEGTLSQGGRYTLLVEGSNSRGETPLDYRFMLSLPQNIEAVLDPAANIGIAPSWTSDGAQPAVALDGQHEIRVAPDPALNLAHDLSFQVRVRVDSFEQNWQSIVYKGGNVNDSSQRTYTLWVNAAGYLHLTTSDNWGEMAVQSDAGSIRAGQWYDITGVFDRSAGQMHLYIDGVLAKSATLRNYVSDARVQDTPLYLGNAQEGWGSDHSQLHGAIGEFRLWDQVLGATRVADYLDSMPDAADPHLKLWLRLEEGSGAALADSAQRGLAAAIRSRFEGMTGVAAGRLDLPGQQAVYRLSLPESASFYLDSLTPNSRLYGGAFNLSVNGPGVSFTENLTYSYNRLITLPAGEYTFTVDSNGGATGQFAFRLINTALAQEIAYRQPVSGTLRPGDTAQLYRFDASAGDMVYFQRLETSGFSPAWRLIDPFGREVFGRAGMDDRDTVALGYTGSYLLVVDGDYYNYDMVSRFSFRMIKQPPAAPVNLDIAVGSDAGVQRTEGSNGGAVEVSDAQYIEFADVPAADQTGSFTLQTSFRVDRWPSGSWIPLVTKTTPDQLRQFGVFIHNNGRIHIGSNPANGGYSSIETAGGLVTAGAWHNLVAVFDRANSQLRIVLNGQLVAQGYLNPQAAAHIADPMRIGYNTEGNDFHGYQVTVDQLAIWNRALATAEAADAGALTGAEAGLAALYRFDEAEGAAAADVRGGASGVVRRLAERVGGLVTGRLTEPGQSQRYTFTLAEPSQLYFDNLTRRHDLRWSLSGPTNTIGTSLQSGDSTNSYHLLALPAGAYTLTIDGVGAATGDFMFRLLDAADATTIPLDQVVSGRLDPGAVGTIYRFDAAAGQRVYFDMLSYTSQMPVWRLLDPAGAQVFGVNWFGDMDVITLARTGTYTLIVEDYTASGSRNPARDFSFMLRTVTDRVSDLLLDERRLREPVWTNGPGEDQAAVQLGNGQQLVVDANAAHDLTGNLTIEAMVRLDALGGGWMPLVSRASDFAHQSYAVWIGAQGQIYFDSNRGGQFWNFGTGNNAIQPGGWHRISVSVDRASGAAAIYVDGQKVASRTLTASERAPATALPDAELRIGGTVLTDNRPPLYGAVADIRLWNVALDAAAIAARHAQRLAGNEAGLVLNLKLAEGAGRYPADSGPNGLGGRIESINSRLAGLLVEDEIGSIGARTIYMLRPDQDTPLLFDSLTTGDRFRWTLLDQNGNAVLDHYGQALAGRNLRDSDGSSRVFFTLRGGREYQLVIDATSDATGRYAFRLAGLQSAQSINYDQPVSGTIDPGNATGLYGFDAAAGDQIVLDYLSHTAGTPVWRLYDPYGRELYSNTFASWGDSGTLTLPHAGRYTIALERPIDGTGAPQHQFQVRLVGQVVPPGLPAGTAIAFTDGVATVEGTITSVDESLVYTFTLAAPRRLFVDTLNSAYPSYYTLWNLAGPQGELARRWSYQTDGVNGRSYFELPAGDYAFSVSEPYSWALGSFAFRLIDIDAAVRPLAVAEQVNGTLTPANGAAFYEFTAEQGERLFFQAGASSNMSSAYWRVLDAQTLAPVAETWYGTLENVRIPRDGRYILAIEGYYGTGGDASFSFTAFRNTDQTRALTLGSRMAVTLAQPGDTARYTFALDADSRLWFDSLSPQGNLVWRVLDRDGISVFGDRNTQDYAWSNISRFNLAAGSYTLEIDGSGAATGNFAFRVLDQAAATPMTPGTAVSGQLTPADATVMYRFSAQAGERYFFDLLSRSSGNTWWRVLDPYGRDLFNGGLSDQGTAALPYSGSYTVVIEGYVHDADWGYGNVEFNFNVQPVLEQAPVQLSIGVRPAPNLVVTNLAVAGVGGDGSVHSGGMLQVSWNSANTGVRDIDIPFQERVVVRNAAGETLVNQLVAYEPGSAGSIVAGGSAARAVTVQLPPGARGAGLLTVSVFTDVANAVAEQGAAGENDNGTQTTVESALMTYPDLTVSNLGIAPAANLAAGDQVTISWRVENGGDRATSTPWSDHIVVRNLSTGEIVLDHVARIEAAGASLAAGSGVDRQLVFNWPAGRVAAGQFQVTVSTDALGEVAEYNAADTAENNNAASTRFTSAPDLLIEDLRVLTAAPVSGGEVQLAWTVRNNGNAPTPSGWYDRITAVNRDTGASLLNLDVFYTPVSPIAAGGSVARSFTLRLPEGAASAGNIRFTVITDQNTSGAGSLPETNDNNNSAAVEREAALRTAPNLVVTGFSAPEAHRSGDPAGFTWTVQNAGNAGTGVAAWHDRIVMSRDAVIGNGDDVTVATVLRDGALDAGAGYTVSVSPQVPGGYDGTYHFALVTDVFNRVAEPDAEGNNTSAVRAALLTAYHADLVPTVVSLPAAAAGGAAVPVTWRVANLGDATTNTNWWVDRLWLSPDGSVGPGSGAIDLGSFGRGGTLAAGASYEVTHNVTMPNGVTGNYKLVVQTDIHGWVFESRFDGNNSAVSEGTIALTEAPAVDLRVENVSGPATAQPGQLQTVSWEIANAGGGEARAPWTDHVYLSRDGTLNGAVYLTALTHDAPLAGGQRLQANVQFWMPDVGDGEWRIVVATDVHGQVYETGAADAESANRGAGAATQVVHPDVRATDIAVSAGATAGRASTITWTTRNDGSALVLPGWFERVFLSSDGALDSGDLLLGTFEAGAELAAGGTLQRSAAVTLPAAMAAGQWRILVQSDSTNALRELAGEGNNVTPSALIAVAAAPLPNLTAANVAGPAAMRPGQTVTVTWDELNTLAEPAAGSWATQIFLSDDANTGADMLVGTASFTGSVPGNSSIARSADIAVPGTLRPGNWRFVVRVDAGNAVNESNELDNTAIAAADSVVSAALQLNLATGNISEAAGSVAATLQRNGDLSRPLTIALSSSDAGEAAVPATVTIPAGQAAVSFAITLPADGIVDGTQTVQIVASAEGLQGDSRALTVNDSDVPALGLASVLAVQENQGTVRMTVSRNTDAAAGELLVRLSSNNMAALRVPGTVVIPVGASSVSFDAALVDDAEVWGTRDVRVNAVADGYRNHSVNVAVADDELPELAIVFSAAQVSEGAGANAVGVTLRRDRPGVYDLVLNIASDNRDALTVPTRVVISAGETEVHFTASPINNDLVNGNRIANVRATMMLPNGMQIAQNAASAAIVVTDDDGPTLTVTLNAESMSELGSAVTGTVRRNTGTAGDLAVSLSSSDATEATVPVTVTIPDGQDSVSFSIHPVADHTVDGAQAVTIRAAAAGFNSGAAGLNVTEGDLPDLVVTEIGQPPGGLAKSRIDVSWTVTNSGRADANGGFRDRVYLSRDAEFGAADRLVAAVIHTAPVARGGSYTQTASIQLPAETGEYRIIVVTDALGIVEEGAERNNAGTGVVPLVVRAPLTATVQTAVTRLAVGDQANGTAVALSGSATDANGAPAGGQPVRVMVRVHGIERLLDTTTDATGNFTLDFKPLPGEVGRFEIGAGYVGDSEFAVQDSFMLIGIEASVPYIRAMGTNETPLEGSFILKNLTDVPLTGLAAAVTGLATNFQFEIVGLTENLAGDGRLTVHWRLTGHGVTDTLQASRGTLVLTTAEGASERLVLDLACIPQTPKLVASPGYLVQGMLRGEQTLVSFEVYNQGAADTGPVQVQIPEFPWLTLVSAAVIDNIAAGGKAVVTLSLRPDDTTPLIRFDGRIALNARLGGLEMPFQFRAVSEARGDMRVTVEDQLTYYAEGSPRPAGATVTLTDPYTLAVMATAVTDETGSVLLSDIPEGNYILTVTADKHSSYRATKIITPGTTSEQTIFLDRQLVTYSWSVVPVDIQDRYKIVLESTFETEVPVPVITVDALKMPVILPGVTSTTSITITNHGLIQAENVEIRVPIDDLFEIVALTPMIDVLPAKSSVVVPITIRVRDGVTAEQLGAATLAGNGLSPEGWGSAIVKCLGIDTAYKLRCGADGRWYTESTDIKPVLCAMDLTEAAGGQLLSYIGNDFNLLDLGCDALDLLLACFDADDCLSFFINAACGAIVGGITAGPAGAAAGAAGALDDLLACMCQLLGPIGGGGSTPTSSNPGGGGWGWYTPYGGFGGSGISYDIQYVNCRGEAVSAVEQQRADEGLLAAVASGAVAADAVAIVAAHNEARADALAQAVADGDGILDAEEAGICAQVRIRLEQEAVLTRTAFQGTLEVVNGNTGVPLTGVQLVLDIRDQDGNAVGDIFVTRAPVLNGLTAIDGTGVLAGGATGRALYVFIPTADAARDQPTRYTIGGTLSYIESGQKITVPLLPAQITVFPEARLNLHYFQQRDVYSDDPFTEEVEPSEEFALGLLAYNDGKGDARDFSITSAQPKIIENEKGLLIDFKIAGTQVGDQAVAPTLTANLGNIAAGKTQVAQWMMTSSLQGKFVDYSATFEHIDGMGDARLSLIESVNIHELIRSVKANAGDAPDFLANDDPDAGHTPDRLYMNDGSQHVVRTMANAQASANTAAGALAVSITADAQAGWGYLKIADPGAGYALDRIVRSDGKVLSLGREVWRTDRTFPESIPGAVRETLLHFIDENSTGRYTAYFKIDDPVAPRLVEIVSVSPDPATGPVDTIDVRFSETLDPGSFTVADLRLSREGDAAVNLLEGAAGVTVTALGNGAYRIGGLAGFTAADGLYRLTVDAAGVTDPAGNAGQGVLTETWGIGEIGPYVLSMASGPAARNTALDAVDVTFNTALDAASFSGDDLRLERNGVVQSLAGAALSLTPLAGNQYRIGGLSAFTAADGDYTLALQGAGLLSSGGAAGLGSQQVGWRMDTVAPQVLNVVDLLEQLRKTVVMALDVELSEQVDPASFDYRDIVLTRTVNGVASVNLIDARTKVEHVAGNTYRVTGFNWVSGQEGNYRFSLNGEGLADAAGNSGGGAASESWVMDFHDPAAAADLAITPDTGSAAHDGLTNTLNFTLSGTLGEEGLAVRISDLTSGNEIGYATVSGTTFSIPVAFDAGGRHELRVRAVDGAGNLADSIVVVFVDQIRPTLAAHQLTRDSDGNVERITLNFSEAVDPASVTPAALSLSRDGGDNLLSGVTLTRVSATQYVASGLAALTAPAGSYRFALDMTQVRDLAGNAGSGASVIAFDGALASTGSVSGVVFDDIDGTGTREADELAQGGWTVFADADGDGALDSGEISAVTGDLGRYTLEGLALGDHRIVVLTPAGWTITPSPTAQVTLGAQAPEVTRNFGAFALAGLSGTVFDDANANGVRDADEAGLAGQLVLLDANGNGAADAGETTSTTDDAGRYRFADLRPGSMRVHLSTSGGWLPLQPAGLYSPKSGDAATRDLAAVRPGVITGTKYDDVNGNSQRDAGEAGIGGWKVFLDDNGNDALDIGERYTLTAADGSYAFFDLLPGSYRIAEEVRVGWIQTAPGTVEAGSGHEQGLDALLSLPGLVADMEEDHLAEYHDSTGANYNCGCGTFVLEKYTTGQSAAHFSKLDTITDSMLANLTGKGVRVAVIDTGIDTGSSFFGPDANDDGVADRIAFQYDFGDGDADASDIIGHGTHVAGVIAGSDEHYDGVATEADLVVLKVFDSSQQGYFSTLKRALEWVDVNAQAYGIGVVNLSLGDGGNWGEAISRYGMGELFQRLAAKGLVTIAASGNNYYQSGGALGVAYPGSDPAVLSVGAMWAGNFGGPWRFSSGATDYSTAYGRIASFTQRDPDQIDVMAPGARFTSAGLNGGLATMQGTSQATAFMSGAAAVAQQAAQILMGRYLTTGEFAALLDVYTYRAVDGDDESDNVVNSSGVYNKLDIPRLLQGLKAYAATGGGIAEGGGASGGDADSPLSAYSARTLTLGAGQTVADQDFGNFRLGQLAGQAFEDANLDGVRQDGEAGRAGVTVFVDANDNALLDEGEQHTATDASGSFVFGALGPGEVNIRALTPEGRQATTATAHTVSVTSGLDLSTLRFGYAAPSLDRFDAVDDSATLDEDASVAIDVLANDVIGDGSETVLTLSGGPAHGSVEIVDGQFVYRPDADFHGSDSFAYTVSGPGGRSSSAAVSITVLPVNDKPTLQAVARQVVDEGNTLVLQLVAADVDAGDSLTYLLLEAPEGATIDTATGQVRWTATDVSAPAAFRVQVNDGAGGTAEQSFVVDVRLGKLVVTAFAPQSWGFAMRFNDVIDQSQFNLYGAAPDLEVLGARAGALAGSVVFDADGRGLRFVRTGGALEADSYTVRLKSGATAVTGMVRGALDGNGDGSAGGDFVSSFTAAALPPVRLRLPDFARGPGQAVQVPNTGTGLPVTLVTDGSARSLSFKLMVDPALIQVSEVRGGSGLPAGADVQVQAIDGGFLVAISSATPIAAGSRQILNIVGRMNESAPLGSAGVLRLEDVAIDGAAVPGAADAGVVYVGYTGDINLDGSYTADDANKLQRLVVKLDRMIAGADDIDPTVIGDVDADGALTSRDVAHVQQRMKAPATPMIPGVPVVSPAAAGGTALAASTSQAVAPASTASGSLAGTTVNLAGKLGNFGLPAAPASSPAVSGASLPVTLKVVPSAVSTGVPA